MCPKCSRGVAPGAKFCTSCGHSMNAASPGQPYQPESYTSPPTQGAPQSSYAPPAQPYTPPPQPYAPPSQPYGAPSQPYGAAPQPAYAQPYAPSAARAMASGTGISPLIYVAIAACVAAVAAVVVFVVIPLVGATPLSPVQRAFANFGEEVAERVERSPFHALVLMNEIYQDGAGTMTFEFDYRSGNMWSPDVRGDFSVAANTRTQEWAASGEVRVMGMPIDLTVVMDRERLAVQSNVIDRDTFYGITFATFDRDMRQFGRMIGLHDRDINEMIDAMRIIEQLMDVEVAMAGDWGGVYTDIIAAFFTNLESTTEDRDIRVGGQNITVNRIEFVITSDDIMRLLHELVDAFERDPVMRNLIEYYSMMLGMPDFNEIMREVRGELRELERMFDGTIILHLYLSRGDRLMQARMDADMRFDGDSETFRVFLDLGSSVEDTWEITMEVGHRWGYDRFTARWDFRQIGQNYVNSLSFIYDWGASVTLESSWNPNTGRFDLSYLYSDHWWSESGGFGGRFNVASDGGFTLELERIEIGWNDTLDLSMTMSPGANIPRIVNFVNIDRWDMALLDRIERSILGMLW